MGTTALMIKTQIGLGVLSMPKVFHVLGIVPGIIILLTIAGMTSWSNWMVGVFKLRHPNVYGIDDVGKMLFGRVGFELFGAAYTLCEFLWPDTIFAVTLTCCKTGYFRVVLPC